MADLLNLSINGLLSYQRAIATTSHNINNANTEGFSRQRVAFSTQTPQFTGLGYEGAGVSIQSVQRVYDAYLGNQYTRSVSAYAEQDQLSRFSRQIDNYLADPASGVLPVLQGFFGSVQDLANDPSSTPVRQLMLSNGESLTTRLNDTYTFLKGLAAGINTDLQASINEVNGLSTAIAKVNNDILLAQGADSSFPPNDLIDQRDKLVNELANYVNVNTVTQTDGTVNVFIGSGQSLVVGTRATQLTTMRNEFDTSQFDIGIVQGGSTVDITNQLNGGRIGGSLQFRNSMLSPALNEIGRMSIGLSDTFNEQHKLGYTLNNAMGGNYFSDLTATYSLASTKNATGSDYIFAATVTDSNLLTSSDYRIDYSSASGGTYTLTRLQDNSVVASAGSIGALSTAAAASEGFSISLGSGTTIADGDQFLLQPTRYAARDISVAVQNTNDIAAAAPLLASSVSTNTGNAAISAGELSAVTGSTLPGTPITLTFDSSTNVFNISTGGTISYNPATDSGASQSITVAGLGTYTFTIKNTPADGDQFQISANSGAVGDNRNALGMIRLQEAKLLANSTANYQEAYGNLVSRVGVQTKQADFTAEANKVLRDRALSAVQEVSGVNLDEEAANLLRYQQSYQAVARLITTADNLFQVLLGAVTR